MRLAEASASDVRLLVRDPSSTERAGWPESWTTVQGDLERPDAWADALPAGGTVVHLAALTGKAVAARHRAVNEEATRRLVRAAEEAGVERFVFVSSIAAGFPNQRHYPYAQAKAAAEQAVRDSGIAHVVVRPTQVFGPGSAVFAGLKSLASAPVGVRFGRSDVAFQPIHVDDLARALVAVLGDRSLDGEVIELGGPEALAARDLLERIRETTKGRRGPWLTVPLGPVRAVLAALEPIAGAALPLTAGQLSSFVAENRGSAHPLPEGHALPAPSIRLEQMLREGTA